MVYTEMTMKALKSAYNAHSEQVDLNDIPYIFFVAGNDTSIIEAYTIITSNGYAFPFGIYEDNYLVGFVMIGYGKDDYWKDAPAIEEGNYNCGD